MGCFSSRGSMESDSEYSSYSEEAEPGPMQEITPCIWLGSCVAGYDLNGLRENGITHICAVGWDLEERFPNEITYCIQNKIMDAAEQPLMPVIKKGIEFIEEATASGGKVLIHCHKGLSRSSTICVAYIMQNRHMTFFNALDYVRERRSCAMPSLGFEFQLYEFEKNNCDLDLSLYDVDQWEHTWGQHMESYLENITLAKTRQLKQDADKNGAHDNSKLFVLTCNWSEVHRHQIKYGKIPEFKEEAVSILIYIMETYVQSPESTAAVKDMFSNKAFEQLHGGGSENQI